MLGSVLTSAFVNLTTHCFQIVQIAEAMAFLHSNGIVHGDLKAANVLISDEIEALLCDFGLASTVQDAMIVLTGAPTSLGDAGR